MKSYRVLLGLLALLSALAISTRTLQAQDKAAAKTVTVHMVITDEAIKEDSEVPALQQGDVKVKQGKDSLKVTHLVPAKGDNGALQLFVLIDDTLDTGVGNNLGDVKDFINAQPAGAQIGVAYMSNATVKIVQNFTPDHDLAAKAVRLPLGRLSAMDSPYLSLISLIKGWPQQKVRREVLMVTDGIDRLHGLKRASPMTTISPDATTASEISQRYGVVVYSIYASSIGRKARSSWDRLTGLSGISQVSEESGGECFSLGTSNLVSFKPYLERLQKYLDNQYYLEFQAIPGKKPGLQRVDVTTEVSGAEIAAADNVWVPSGS